MRDILTQPKYLVILIPLAWIVLRTLHILARGCVEDRSAKPIPSPYGPSGEVLPDEPSCLPILLTVASGAALLGFGWWPFFGDLTYFIKIPATVILVPIGMTKGLLLDIFLSDWVGQSLTRRRMKARLPRVENQIDVGSDESKASALVVVGYCAGQPEAVRLLPKVIANFRSPNAELRYLSACTCMAVVQHARGGPADMGPELRRLLEDPEVKVRAPVARALVSANLADLDEVVEPLVSSLFSKDHTVFGMVSYFLDQGRTWPARVIPTIFEAISENEALGVGALELAFRWCDESARPELERGLEHKDEQVRRLAETALANLDAQKT